MFRKILVANRGEIAIRAFRAAYELGAATVAVFPYEDRNSMHRLKADEAYQIGEPGHPVRAYLDVQEIIRVAKESGGGGHKNAAGCTVAGAIDALQKLFLEKIEQAIDGRPAHR